MYNLKQSFEEFLSTSGMEGKIEEKAKMILKQAWMAGASCVLKEFAKEHNKNPRQAVEVMRNLGKDAHVYDQYKEDMQKQINRDIDAQIKEEGHNPIGFGGLFGYPFGFGYGGYPNFWNYSVRYRHHDDDKYDHWRDRNWDRDYPGHRHYDGRMYGKDYVDRDARGMREKYPDVEAKYYPSEAYNPYKGQADKYDEYRIQDPKSQYSALAGTTTPDGKVYSADGKTYTHQGHAFYSDGRMIN